ncbi:MAG: phage shock protein [Candidatus Eremiobacteraeota bacterium]|jgi:phage shock protein A|nr:phage shock protein [Candidatus Eremiobacteraeota bacterium]
MSLWTRIVRLLQGEARSQIERLDNPAASVDAAYRAQLEVVDEVRRHLVELLTARKRLEMQLGTYERSGAQREAVDAFRAEIEELRGREDTLATASEELRRRADALRAERDITRARVAAAKAGIAAHGAIAGISAEHAEIRTLLDDARERTLSLQARAAALAELVALDANAGQRAVAAEQHAHAEATVDREMLAKPPE